MGSHGKVSAEPGEVLGAERVPAGAELLDPSAGFAVRWDQPGTEVRAPRAHRVSPASGLSRCR